MINEHTKKDQVNQVVRIPVERSGTNALRCSHLRNGSAATREHSDTSSTLKDGAAPALHRSLSQHATMHSSAPAFLARSHVFLPASQPAWLEQLRATDSVPSFFPYTFMHLSNPLGQSCSFPLSSQLAQV